MCRPSWTKRSRYSDPSPNAASASWAAEASAACSSARCSTRRMPRPPPPAAAFTRSGQPTSSATAAMCARDAARSKRAGSSVPGTTGTPASRAARRAASLSPRPASVAGAGPTKTRPAARQASAKAALLGQEAVAGVDRLGPGGQGRRHDAVGAQVALGGRGRAQSDRLVGRSHVGRGGIGIAVDGHALEAQLTAGPDEADGDLAPVGDEDAREGP